MGLVFESALVHEQEIWVRRTVPTMMMVRVTANRNMNAFCFRVVLAAKYNTMEASITIAAVDWEQESPNMTNLNIICQ